MTANKLVSVVIPVYNGEQTLGAAIKSVLGQSYSYVEVVVVNDGSFDSSSELIATFENEVRVVNQPNAGVAAARNRGIRESTGEYVAFLDQDDFWHSKKLELQVDLLTANPAVGLVHTQVEYYEVASGGKLPLLNSNAGTDEIVGSCKQRLLLGNGMYNSSVLVRRTVLEAVGLANEEIDGNSVQDYDLWLRCAEVCEFAFVPEPVSFLGVHEGQGTWNRTLMLSEEVALLLRHLPYAEWMKWPEGRERLGGLHAGLGVALLDAGEFSSARAALIAALRYHTSVRGILILLATFFPPPILRLLRNRS